MGSKGDESPAESRLSNTREEAWLCFSMIVDSVVAN